MTLIKRLFEDLSGIEKMMIAFIFYHLFLGLYLAIFNGHYFAASYTLEDGLIEWLQFEGLVLSFLLATYRFFTLKKGVLFSLSLFALAALMFFGAGEEISWGQRLFNIKSAEFFIQNNSQQEMNLHNLVVEGKKINKIIFGLGLTIVMSFYLLVLPILYRKIESVKKWSDKLAVPIPRNIHIILYFLVVVISQITPSGKRGELLEFGGVFSFFLMLYNPLNREIYKKTIRN